MLTWALIIIIGALALGFWFYSNFGDASDFRTGALLGGLAGFVVGLVIVPIMSGVVSFSPDTTVTTYSEYNLEQYCDGSGVYYVDISSDGKDKLKYYLTYTNDDDIPVRKSMSKNVKLNFKDETPKVEITDINLAGAWWLFAWDFSDPYYTITVPSKDYIRY